MFNSSTLNDLRNDLDKVLSTYGINNGMNFQIGRISYTDEYANISMKVYLSGNNVDGAESEFNDIASRIGIPKEWYKKRVSIKGKMYTITGLNSRARKFPVILEGDDGSSIRATADSVKINLKTP